MVSRMPFGPKVSSFQFALPKTSSCISVDSKLSPLFIVAGRISTGPASRKGFAMTRVLVSFGKSPAPCLHPYWFLFQKTANYNPDEDEYFEKQNGTVNGVQSSDNNNMPICNQPINRNPSVLRYVYW